MARSRRNKKVRGILREANRVYELANRDGTFDNDEILDLMSVLQDAVDSLQDSISHQNPQQCYMGYTTALTFGKKMSDSQIRQQAEKDGFDPDMVLFLSQYVNADDMDALENPRKGRNLGYGTKNGGMAKNQLRTIKRLSVELHDAILKEDELPAWVLSKITVAQDRLSVATEYILSKLRELELIEKGHKMNPSKKKKK